MTAVTYLAGTPWAGVAGTDRHLASTLGADHRVLFVDPPVTTVGWVRDRWQHRAPEPLGCSDVDGGITRLRVPAPPMLTRRPVLPLTYRWHGAAVRRTRLRMGLQGGLVVAAGPLSALDPRDSARRVLYVTDDWVAGAELMGLPRAAVLARLRANMRHAHVVAAVSPHLVDRLQSLCDAPVALLPNGCLPPLETHQTPHRPADLPPGEHVGVIGQLNERIDLGVLQALADAGHSLVLIGPRTANDPAWVSRMEDLIALPQVAWLGERPADEIPGYLSHLRVGLTPYVNDDFNRASFPLKTLEYLAAGLPVVSTDLPAARWLKTDLLRLALGRADFVRQVADALQSEPRPREVADRRALAARHSWTERSRQLLALAALPSPH